MKAVDMSKAMMVWQNSKDLLIPALAIATLLVITQQVHMASLDMKLALFNWNCWSAKEIFVGFFSGGFVA